MARTRRVCTTRQERCAEARLRLRDMNALAWAERLARRHGTTLDDVLDTDVQTAETCRVREELSAVLYWTFGLAYVETARILSQSDHNGVRRAVHRRGTKIAQELGIPYQNSLFQNPY